jgi:hypothetical protein
MSAQVNSLKLDFKLFNVSRNQHFLSVSVSSSHVAHYIRPETTDAQLLPIVLDKITLPSNILLGNLWYGREE